MCPGDRDLLIGIGGGAYQLTPNLAVKLNFKRFVDERAKNSIQTHFEIKSIPKCRTHSRNLCNAAWWQARKHKTIFLSAEKVPLALWKFAYIFFPFGPPDSSISISIPISIHPQHRRRRRLPHHQRLKWFAINSHALDFGCFWGAEADPAAVIPWAL